MMKPGLVFVSLLMMMAAVSCKKGSGSIDEPVSQRLGDSCSYVIDGKTYTCNTSGSRGHGIMGMGLDTATKTWNADSLIYFTVFSLGHTEAALPSAGGYLQVYFTKKYGKNQLSKPLNDVPHPASELDLYAVGGHPYSIEFQRFNTTDGIAMDVDCLGCNTRTTRYSTYIYTSAFWPTTLGPDMQKDAKFKITKLEKQPDGFYLLEALFTANIFDPDEKGKRVENGYLRTYISDRN
jgi:hypothetical protein